MAVSRLVVIAASIWPLGHKESLQTKKRGIDGTGRQWGLIRNPARADLLRLVHGQGFMTDFMTAYAEKPGDSGVIDYFCERAPSRTDARR